MKTVHGLKSHVPQGNRLPVGDISSAQFQDLGKRAVGHIFYISKADGRFVYQQLDGSWPVVWVSAPDDKLAYTDGLIELRKGETRQSESIFARKARRIHGY